MEVEGEALEFCLLVGEKGVIGPGRAVRAWAGGGWAGRGVCVYMCVCMYVV